MSRLLRFLILIAVFGPIPGFCQKVQRALPDDNLAYPVLVTFKNSQGSGFYLTTPSALYLVTATHVLYDPADKKPI